MVNGPPRADTGKSRTRATPIVPRSALAALLRSGRNPLAMKRLVIVLPPLPLSPPKVLGCGPQASIPAALGIGSSISREM